MAELVKTYEFKIQSFLLVPSDGGRFEITVNDRLLYSKLQTNRHAEEGEVSKLIEKYLKEN